MMHGLLEEVKQNWISVPLVNYLPLSLAFLTYEMGIMIILYSYGCCDDWRLFIGPGTEWKDLALFPSFTPQVAWTYLATSWLFIGFWFLPPHFLGSDKCLLVSQDPLPGSPSSHGTVLLTLLYNYFLTHSWEC